MAYQIKLEGLRVFGHHGVFDFEKAYGQWFVIDAKVWIDRDVSPGDDIRQTLHYGSLADALVEDASKNPVDLIETLAERLLERVFELGGESVAKARVTVHKPHAPINHEFRDVSVTLKRKRIDE